MRENEMKLAVEFIISSKVLCGIWSVRMCPLRKWSVRVGQNLEELGRIWPPDRRENRQFYATEYIIEPCVNTMEDRYSFKVCLAHHNAWKPK